MAASVTAGRAARLGADPALPWQLVRTPDAGEFCRRGAEVLRRAPISSTPIPAPPAEFGRRHCGTTSTQTALGRFLTDLSADGTGRCRRAPPALVA